MPGDSLRPEDIGPNYASVGMDEGEEDINRKLDSFFQDADTFRSSLEKPWEECERYYHGRHWQGDKGKPVKNYIFAIVESEVPILTDSRPAPTVLPWEQEEGADEKAQILSSCMQYVFDEQKLEVKLAQGVRRGLVSGNGYLYVDYDPDLDRGEGSITIRNLNWRNIWLDPSSSELDEAFYTIIKFPVRVEEIARRFNKDQAEIKRVSATFLGQSEDSYEGVDPSRWSPAGASDNSSNRYGGNDMTVLEEHWFKDYTMEEIPPEEITEEIAKEAEQLINGINPDIHKFENHAEHIKAHEDLKRLVASQRLQVPPETLSEEVIQNLASQDEEVFLIFKVIDDHIESHKALLEINPESKRPKYKNNLRLVLRIDRDIYYDGEAPVDDGMVPLVPIYCYKEDDCPYGFGEVKNLLPIQKSFNDMDNAEYEGLMLCSNPGWVKDDASNVADNTLTNEPGLIVTKRAGTEVKRLEPGQVSPQLAQRREDERISMRDISGVQESTTGKKPTGVTAASAIRYLQEQSVGRIRLNTRFQEGYSMLRLGQLVISRIIKYWSAERKLRIYDDNGKIKYVDFNPGDFHDFRYDVKIVPGSTAGLDKESIFSLYSDLVMKGVIDAKTFFMAVDIPYKNVVLERLEQLDQTNMIINQLNEENLILKQQLGIPVESQNQSPGPTQPGPMAVA